MAILENPQEPCVVLKNQKQQQQDKKNKKNKKGTNGGGSEQHNHKPLKKKPSRTLLYIRHRANASNLSLLCVGIILTVLSFHRLFSLYMSHRRWLNSPITYLQRTCPSPSYQPLILASRDNNNKNNNKLTTNSNSATAGKVCMTTLTDAKSPSYIQRLLRWRNYDGILELTWPNKYKYAKKNGYYLYDGSALIDTSRPPAWSKILAVQHLLRNENCDWVMWTDADTVIMNSNVRIEDFLPQDSTKDLLVGSDDYGGGYNSGVFVVRNSEWSKRFMQQWWDMDSYVRPPGLSLSGDNNAMKALLWGMQEGGENNKFQSKVLVPPRCTFNSFAHFLTVSESVHVMDHLTEQEWYMNDNYYHKTDFIAHTPGYDNKQECIKLLLQEAE